MALTCVALPDGRYQTKTLPRCVDVASIKIDGISLLVLEKESYSNRAQLGENERDL